MSLLLKILLVVGAVLLALLLGAKIWFRRMIKRHVADWDSGSELLDASDFQPARIRLTAAIEPQPSDALTSLVSRAGALGFKALRNFEPEGGTPFSLVRGLQHPEHAAGLALADGPEGATSYLFFSIDKSNRVTALGNGRGQSLEVKRLRWDVDPALSLEEGWSRFKKDLGEQHQSMSVRLFRAIFEQSYAVRADTDLAEPPAREAIEERALAKGMATDDEAVSNAQLMLRNHWEEQVSEAVLDRYRRSEKLEASRWLEIEDYLHVVHAQLDADSVTGLLGYDEGTETLIRQLTEQGLEGLALYQAVVERLPENRRPQHLKSVTTPIRAELYLYEPDDPPAEGEGEIGARPFIYTGKEKAGGALLANSTADAQSQLSESGAPGARVLMEGDMLNDDLKRQLQDPKLAELASKAVRETPLTAFVKGLFRGGWIWIPPALLTAWNVRQGKPYGLGDMFGFGYLALAVVFLLFLLLPLLINAQAERARIGGHWGRALTMVRLLKLLDPTGSLKVQTEQLAVTSVAGAGQLEEALSRWEKVRGKANEYQYYTGLAEIYDYARQTEQRIAVQREHAASDPNNDLVSLDLAMSLAKADVDLELARSIVERLNPAALSELAQCGYLVARGLIALRDERYDLAIRHLQQAQQQVAQFNASPIAGAFAAECRGYIALCVLLTGDRSTAERLWEADRGLLETHPSTADLVADYQAASRAAAQAGLG